MTIELIFHKDEGILDQPSLLWHVSAELRATPLPGACLPYATD